MIRVAPTALGLVKGWIRRWWRRRGHGCLQRFEKRVLGHGWGRSEEGLDGWDGGIAG
jgi:hypothetical protein